MVKLYYTPTSSAASSFICAYLCGLNYECEIVDLTTHVTETGVDFYTINAKGNVPTIVLDDGTVLNENISCLTFIADDAEKNGKFMAPSKYDSKRYEVLQLMSFIATELQSTISLLFDSRTKYDDQLRDFIVSNVNRKLLYFENHIFKDGAKYIYENELSVVDVYLHIILSWTGYVNLDISRYNKVKKYYFHITSLPEIRKAKSRMAMMPIRILKN